MSDLDSQPPADMPGGPSVVEEVRTSATAALIPTIRAVASDLAARADFDLDAISDLRMAVDEACATLVNVAAPVHDAAVHVLADQRAEREPWCRRPVLKCAWLNPE